MLDNLRWQLRHVRVDWKWIVRAVVIGLVLMALTAFMIELVFWAEAI